MEDRVLDWQVYEDTARKMVTEGMVLLKMIIILFR